MNRDVSPRLVSWHGRSPTASFRQFFEEPWSHVLLDPDRRLFSSPIRRRLRKLTRLDPALSASVEPSAVRRMYNALTVFLDLKSR